MITLLVTPENAQKLTLASNQGKIQLALRNPSDVSQGQLTSMKSGGCTGTLCRRQAA